MILFALGNRELSSVQGADALCSAKVAIIFMMNDELRIMMLIMRVPIVNGSCRCMGQGTLHQLCAIQDYSQHGSLTMRKVNAGQGCTICRQRFPHGAQIWKTIEGSRISCVILSICGTS